RPRDRHAHARDFTGREPVVLDRREVDTGQRLQDGRRRRSLQGEQRITRARVHRRRVAADVLHARGDPLEVLDDVRRVHDQHEVIVGQLVGQDVVDEGALRRGQRGVLDLPVRQPAGVVRGDVLDRLERVGAVPIAAQLPDPGPSAIVAGRVVDAATGRPVWGVIVTPAGTAADPGPGATAPARVLTNPNGQFVLRGLSKGSLVLTATK